MRAHTEYLWFTTKNPRELINITDRVADIVETAGVEEGFCLVSAMHITSGIWVNDEESGLKEDLIDWLDRLAPRADYRHHRTGEDNADAHLKRTLVHHQVILRITAGKLDLGPWEQVFSAEFDGRRKKRVVVKVLGEWRRPPPRSMTTLDSAPGLLNKPGAASLTTTGRSTSSAAGSRSSAP